MDNKTFEKIHHEFLKSYKMLSESYAWLPNQKQYRDLKLKIEKILKTHIK